MYERRDGQKGRVSTIIKAGLGTFVFALILLSNFSTIRTRNVAQAVDSPLITITNKDRKDVNLDILYSNSKLNKAAQAKADDIINNQYFDHNRFDGVTPWDFIKNTGYKYHRAGENLAIGFDDFNEANDAWLNSPSHKANILNPHYKEIGIGAIRGVYQGEEVLVIVQMFGEP